MARTRRTQAKPEEDSGSEFAYREAEVLAAQATSEAHRHATAGAHRVAAACHRRAAQAAMRAEVPDLAQGHLGASRAQEEAADRLAADFQARLRRIAPDLEDDVRRIVAETPRRAKRMP